MTRKVFGVFDSVAKNYGYPILFVHEGEAVRWFSDTINDERSQLNKHPSDFKLYRLGEFDDVSGEFKTLIPEHICNAVDFVKKGVVREDKRSS